MATPRYDALMGKVLSWSNRDLEILGNPLVNDCLEYAADDAYRILRVPPLESIRTYTISSSQAATGGRTLAIPHDLSSFIQLRRQENVQGGGQLGISPYTVYTAKNDIRSFYDIETCKPEYFRWTRQQNEIHVHPNYQAGNVFELYYYRRLPVLNAVYVVNAANAGTTTNPTAVGSSNGFITVVAAPVDPAVPGDACELFYTTEETMDADGNPVTNYLITDEAITDSISFWATGDESPHWLKDEHERTLLYGGLKYAFSYLQEPEQMAQYDRLFMEELKKLNDEENHRKYAGGGTTVHFATGGLI